MKDPLSDSIFGVIEAKNGPKSVSCQVVANLVRQLSFDKIAKIMYYYNYFHVLPASWLAHFCVLALKRTLRQALVHKLCNRWQDTMLAVLANQMP